MRCSCKAAFEECNIKYRGVVIDELEHKDFQGQRIIEFRLRPVQLHFRQVLGNPRVELWKGGNGEVKARVSACGDAESG